MVAVWTVQRSPGAVALRCIRGCTRRPADSDRKGHSCGARRGLCAAPVAAQRVSLAHWCVAPDARGTGVARALVDAISEKHAQRLGIRAKCRDDYELADTWTSLGYSVASLRARGRRTGRCRHSAPTRGPLLRRGLKDRVPRGERRARTTDHGRRAGDRRGNLGVDLVDGELSSGVDDSPSSGKVTGVHWDRGRTPVIYPATRELASPRKHAHLPVRPRNRRRGGPTPPAHGKLRPWSSRGTG